MGERVRAVVLALVGAALAQACDGYSSTEPQGGAAASAKAAAVTPTIITATGAIEGAVTSFRAVLGNPNNGSTPGQQPAGRREVNWDGVPAAFTNVNFFPNDFFNAVVPRGLFYVRKGKGLEVSDGGFTDINPAYAGVFNPFSGAKTFSPVGTNEADVRFRVAGSETKAAVRGFGVVFVDVDRVGSAIIELLGEHGEKLGRFSAPVRSDARGLSFVGVAFSNSVISRVRIVSGEAPLDAREADISEGGSHDLVVMDDFFYGEPVATQ